MVFFVERELGVSHRLANGGTHKSTGSAICYEKIKLKLVHAYPIERVSRIQIWDPGSGSSQKKSYRTTFV